MSSQDRKDRAFQTGDVAKLVGVRDLEGVKVRIVKHLQGDKWAVALEGDKDTGRSKMVSINNLQKLDTSEVSRKPCFICGTWDDWESHEMTWDGSLGCYRYPVVVGKEGQESFKVLVDGDWDSCVYPDRDHANPYEDHEICGPDSGGYEFNWTIGRRREERAQEGALFQVRFYIFPDGTPMCVKWEASSHSGGQQEDTVKNEDTPQAQVPRGSRLTVKDLLKKVPKRDEDAPQTARRRTRMTGPKAPSIRSGPEPSSAPQGSLDATPAEAEIPAEKTTKPLSKVLREVSPQSTPQEIAQTKANLTQAGIKSTEDLEQALRAGRNLEALPQGFDEALSAYFDLIPEQSAQEEASPTEPEDPAKKAVNLWEVAGEKGLLVRAGSDKNSEALEEKISFGSLLEEIEIIDGRLHYKKRTGSGPPEGWVLLKLNGRELVKPAVEAEKQVARVPARSAPRAQAATQDMPRASNRAPPPAEPTRQPYKDLPVELQEQASRLNVQLENLHDQSPAAVVGLLERLSKVTRSTASKLQVQYTEMGYPMDLDDMVERAEMVTRVSEALLWQELGLIPLQEVCAKKGLEVVMEQPRQELLQMLLNLEWEELGIPITRIGSSENARGVFCQVNSLKNAGTNELASEIKRFGLPTNTSTTTMIAHLKQALIWKALSTAELLRECKAYGLDVGITTDSTRQECFDKLVSCMWGNRCEARGIPANRLPSPEIAEELLEKVDRLQVMGPLTLQVEYRKMGVTYDPELDMQALVDRLRDMLVWEALSLSELQEECRVKGLPSTDGRKAMLQRLHKRLDDELELERQGLPVRRLGGYEAAMELMEQHELIDQMTVEDLMMWYRSTGLPEENYLSEEELADIMRAVAVWEALPMLELLRECAKHKVVVSDLRDVGSEARQRELLVTKLLQQQRMERWEELGFRAKQIGFEEVWKVVQSYSKFENMGREELERAYAEEGLPREPDMDRAAMLDVLKKVLVWEATPLFDLQMECLEVSDKIKCDFQSTEIANEQRKTLVRQLVVETLGSAYESIGVPVERIGYLEAYNVGRNLVTYSIMGVEELLKECEKLGLRVYPEMTRDEFIASLRQCVLWEILPAEQLWDECVRRGIHERLRDPLLGLLRAQISLNA